MATHVLEHNPGYPPVPFTKQESRPYTIKDEFWFRAGVIEHATWDNGCLAEIKLAASVADIDEKNLFADLPVGRLSAREFGAFPPLTRNSASTTWKAFMRGTS